MNEYIPTIGLEIHAELKTRTKMFCDSLNDPDERHPNKNVCPVCLGHPGALPFVNKRAVEAVIRVGLALGGGINPVTKFDRKNYFYPDLPKGYQISQYDRPLVAGGSLNGVRLTRIHLEEDTGTLAHTERDISPTNREQPASLVDFNRAGVPLMELVTEPDLKNADEAVAFAKELQLILRYLGVSDADMEKGQMRIEANVSISPKAEDPTASGTVKKLGTKVELKNINSFKAVHDAIEYEIVRQAGVLENKGAVRQETRGWNDTEKISVSQRSKEDAHDYRYFPEPDLPPFETAAFDIKKLREELPELPKAKKRRFTEEYGLAEIQVELLAGDPGLSKYFEEAASELKLRIANPEFQILINYLTSDLRGLMNAAGIDFGALKIEPEHLAHLVFLIGKGKIGSRQAKDVLAKMFETGLDPEDIVKNEGLETVSDNDALKDAAQKVIGGNPEAVTDFRKGRKQAVQFLVGRAMAELKGRGDPNLLRALIESILQNKSG